ncbi:hypothetical protein V1477_014342 [Vespula maculifrons]|uniref:Uncharacterized protein n=1 Tax=Vespula maculifrons TaxID=7453 RepID=A0ABD2BKR9_VESMC
MYLGGKSGTSQGVWSVAEMDQAILLVDASDASLFDRPTIGKEEEEGGGGGGEEEEEEKEKEIEEEKRRCYVLPIILSSFYKSTDKEIYRYIACKRVGTRQTTSYRLTIIIPWDYVSLASSSLDLSRWINWVNDRLIPPTENPGS